MKSQTEGKKELKADEKGITFEGDSSFLQKCLEYLIDKAMTDKMLKSWLIWYVTPDVYKEAYKKYSNTLQRCY